MMRERFSREQPPQQSAAGIDVVIFTTTPTVEGKRITAYKGVVTGESHVFDFQNLHRNKRSLTINLKDPKVKETF